MSQDELNKFLLSDTSINAIMGANEMVTYRTYTDIPVQPGEIYSDMQCAGALFNTTVPAYRDSGYVAARGRKIGESVSIAPHDVDQGVVAFENASEATKFVEASIRQWQACGGKRVTYTGTDGVADWWTIGTTRSAGEITAIANVGTNTGVSGWGCSHAIASKSNVVVDVDACGYHIGDEATTIVKTIISVTD